VTIINIGSKFMQFKLIGSVRGVYWFGTSSYIRCIVILGENHGFNSSFSSFSGNKSLNFLCGRRISCFHYLLIFIASCIHSIPYCGHCGRIAACKVHTSCNFFIRGTPETVYTRRTCVNLSANQSRLQNSSYWSDWLGDLRTQNSTSIHGFRCTPIVVWYAWKIPTQSTIWTIARKNYTTIYSQNWNSCL